MNNGKLKAFIPTIDRNRAKLFYTDVLGLNLVSEDDYGTELDADGTPLRITTVNEFAPHAFTVLGWVVPDVAGKAAELSEKGVVFEKYGFLAQDAAGIWTAPGGTKIAWFKDPDGNVLSLND